MTQRCQHALVEIYIPTVPRCYFLRWTVDEEAEVTNSTCLTGVECGYQIVIPRKMVLNLAHETPMAGHLGVNKTHRRVLDHFYWPGASKDVKDFCRSCHTCQVVGKANQKPKAVPLEPIPMAKEPFSHVIIDCMGPLPKT